ncbi:hypothetical protein H632_c407p2 [Helicosporidium sp. ATCC 50920]|nr:hypothetical protein H632_c407p2 [Helicosporidium sp. ATCC 50920]|eukprot:KDD75987.1 hypothetical protein H632_c407p2 [Helicosporidium sp. ATCC 50920]
MTVRPKLLTGQVLLGKKLRGFGAGYINGFGGKVEIGESVEECAHRELVEEAGIMASMAERRGVLTFVFDDKPEPWEVHVFKVASFSGEPTTSDEMEPVYFADTQIPFEKMWADDVLWYPLFLADKRFVGKMWFENTHTLVKHELAEVEVLPPCGGRREA